MQNRGQSVFRKLTFIPVALVGGVLINETWGAYQRTRLIAKFVARQAGYQFDKPRFFPEHPLITRGIGWTSAAGVFYGIYAAFKWTTDRILLSKQPNKGRLFDRIRAPSDRIGEPVTLARVWRLLGPGATPETLRLYWKLHGLRSTSMFLAAMWSVFLTPVIHARIEAGLVEKGDPLGSMKDGETLYAEYLKSVENNKEGRKEGGGGVGEAGRGAQA